MLDSNNNTFDIVDLSSNPIIILDKEQKYKTRYGDIGFGEIVVNAFNKAKKQHDEIDLLKCFVYDENGKPYFNFPPDYFETVLKSSNIKFFELYQAFSSEFSDSVKELGIHTKNINDIISKIQDASITLPFGVGFYQNRPTLFYKGIEENLFIYDLMMIYEKKIKIRICKNCRYAFISKSNKLYCDKEECQEAKRLKKCVNTSPIATRYKLLYNKMRDRIFKNAEYQTDIFNKLNFIFTGDALKVRTQPKKYEKYISDWEQLYEKINTIAKYMRKKSTDKDLVSLWKNEAETMSTTKSVELWVKKWDEIINK